MKAAITSIIIVFLLSNLAMGLIVSPFQDLLSPGLSIMIAYVGSFLLTIGYAVLLAKITNLRIPTFSHGLKKLNPRLIVSGLILTLAAGIVISPLLALIPETYMDGIDTMMQSGFWAMITAIVAAPIFEEFLFRGIIQRNIERRWGAVWGIVLSSAIFGLIHFVPQQVVNATVVGLILGAIYFLSHSLNTVIAIHFLNNGLAYLQFMIFGNTSNIERELIPNDTWFVIIYAISALLLILGVLYVIEKSKIIQKKLEHLQKNS